MKKQAYEMPKALLLSLQVTDIITASPTDPWTEDEAWDIYY